MSTRFPSLLSVGLPSVLSALFLGACSDADPTGPEPSVVAFEAGVTGASCMAKQALSERLRFPSIDRAGKILRHPDPWARQLSTFDRGARMRTLDPTTVRDFLRFASTAASNWTPAEQDALAGLVEELSRAAEGLNVKLPPVMLIKTTGREEFEAAYTRGRTIAFPERRVALIGDDPRSDFFLLAHELFHVLSREDPALRDDLYALLGFERFAGFAYPPELEGRRLSNPDAFRYEHALTVQTTSGPASVVPVNQSTAPLEEVIQLPDIFGVLDIVLLPIDRSTGEVQRDGGGALITHGFGDTDWVPQMLRNSNFIIHPEEVLADNFATLMEWRATGVLPETTPGGFPINDEDLLAAMEDVLTASCER